MTCWQTRASRARRWPRPSPTAAWCWRPPRARATSISACSKRATAPSAAVQEARRGSGAVAVLFGTERFGLSNEQLLSAHALLRIPANPEYTSLNIAMAAQLIAYEIRMAQREGDGTGPAPRARRRWRRPREMERLYAHLEAGDGGSGLPRSHAKRHAASWGASAACSIRAELDGNEVNILRGILTAVQSRRRRAGDEH